MKQFTNGGRVLHVHGETGRPDATDGIVPCCIGHAARGPGGCTCWRPVHDRPQQPPDLTADPPAARPTMCGSCAFRPGSPELTGADNAAYDPGDLQALINNPAAQFWCHDGMRYISAERHPAGAELVLVAEGDTPLAYDPPQVGGVLYRADGQPAYLCAGLLTARRRAERQR